MTISVEVMTYSAVDNYLTIDSGPESIVNFWVESGITL